MYEEKKTNAKECEKKELHYPASLPAEAENVTSTLHFSHFAFRVVFRISWRFEGLSPNAPGDLCNRMSQHPFQFNEAIIGSPVGFKYS